MSFTNTSLLLLHCLPCVCNVREGKCMKGHSNVLPGMPTTTATGECQCKRNVMLPSSPPSAWRERRKSRVKPAKLPP